MITIALLLTIIASGMVAIGYMHPDPNAVNYYDAFLRADVVFAYSGILFLAVYLCALFVRERPLHIVGAIGVLEIAFAMTILIIAVNPS